MFTLQRTLSTFGIACLVSALVCGACSAQERIRPVADLPSSSSIPVPNAAPSVTGPSNSPATQILIGDGDLLQVSVYGMPDFNQQVRVSNGQITLPMIGAVQVRGLSPNDAEALISTRLKEGGFFRNPQVSVLDREFATQGVSVLGEVQKPGVYPLLGPRKLFDLLSEAGGTAPDAGPEISISHRLNPGAAQTVTLSNDPNTRMQANVDVYPGDTVVVSKAGIVYVVGDVHQPGGFILSKGKELTVLQALALAQGANNLASLNQSKIIHKAPNGAIEQRIYLKKVLEGKAEDPKLQADDILFVPHNGTKEATAKGLQTVLQTVAGVAIYRF